VARRAPGALPGSLAEAERSFGAAPEGNNICKSQQTARHRADAASHGGAVALRAGADCPGRESRQQAHQSNAALTIELLDEIEQFRKLTSAAVPKIDD
jgi:hypothetical protein